MIGAFESRLADLLADRLPGPLGDRVARSRGEAPDPSDDVVIVPELMTAESDPQLGDDSRERIGERGSRRLRPLLRLNGEVEVHIEAAASLADVNPADPDRPRRRMLEALDAVLLALHPEGVRSGRDFSTNVDLGFELDGFRLITIEPDSEAPSFRAVRAVYGYRGRFWPVEQRSKVS